MAPEDRRQQLPSVLSYAPLAAGLALAGSKFKSQFTSEFNNPIHTVREQTRAIQKKVVGSLGQPRVMFQSAIAQSSSLMTRLLSQGTREALAESPEAAAEAFKAVMINPAFYQVKESMEKSLTKAGELLSARRTTELSEFIVKQVADLGPGAALTMKQRFGELSQINLATTTLEGLTSSWKFHGMSGKWKERQMGLLRQKSPELASVENKFGMSATITGRTIVGHGKGRGVWARLELPLSGGSPLVYHIPLNQQIVLVLIIAFILYLIVRV
jgi:hypothetical protein